MRKVFILVLAMPFMAMQCNKKKSDCNGAICTEMFAAVNVTVTDKSGNNVDLKDYYTINVATGDTLRHNNGTWPEGAYTVLDDSYVSKMYNKQLQFRFIGIRNNTTVVDELYSISADCCHISKVAGKDTVVID
jgi:hypothetical protein